MKTWLVLSLLSMLCWGCYIVLTKVAISEKYCGLGPRWTTLLMVVGIIIVMGAYVALSKGPIPTLTPASAAVGISTGALWALGMLFSVLAIGMGADVSRITPIYNCNTLVAVLLGVMVLKEIPDATGIVRIVIGSLLIVFGGILVAK